LIHSFRLRSDKLLERTIDICKSGSSWKSWKQSPVCWFVERLQKT